MNENEFSNVGLYKYGNVKRQRFPTVDEDTTCTLRVKYGEMSPKKCFVHRATRNPLRNCHVSHKSTRKASLLSQAQLKPEGLVY